MGFDGYVTDSEVSAARTSYCNFILWSKTWAAQEEQVW